MPPFDPQHTYVAIMAGGVGSRFWPASRNARPKQFLDMMGTGKSLVRSTFERFQKLCPTENIFVVTNGQYQGLVQEHLPELSSSQILCEPSRNNTAPCVAYAGMKLNELDPDSTMVVAPSDHLIADEAAFIEHLQEAVTYAREHDSLLTLGIRPDSPHTGYGYIQYEKPAMSGRVHRVKAFREKPDRQTARQFLESGDYLWNAGIFIWHTRSILEAFRAHAPEIHRILSAGKGQYNTPKEQAFIDEAYPRTPSISVDYAIMEKAQNVCTIPSSFGWSDLGSWNAVYDLQKKDQEANVIRAGAELIEDSRKNLIQAGRDKLVVIKGLEDYIVVDDDDVLLIYPRSEEQGIKQVTARLREENLDRYL